MLLSSCTRAALIVHSWLYCWQTAVSSEKIKRGEREREREREREEIQRVKLLECGDNGGERKHILGERIEQAIKHSRHQLSGVLFTTCEATLFRQRERERERDGKSERWRRRKNLKNSYVCVRVCERARVEPDAKDFGLMVTQ